MPSPAAALVTFAEFEQLPDPLNAHRLELHHGEVVLVPPPKHRHKTIERHLRRELEATAGDAGVVETEVGFRALPDNEWRVADVAFVSKQRWQSISPDGYLQGAPELVIEILSPSNTASEMLDREQICLENGSVEFWVVDPMRCQVRVSTRDGRSEIYKAGQTIPLMFGDNLAVDAIFE